MTTYTVETMHGCRIIRGSVPLGDMAALLKSAPEGALMDLQLADRIGATMVYGEKEALDKLRAEVLPMSAKRRAQVEAARAAGMGIEAIAWISEGDRGRSSDTLFSAITGVCLLPPEDYATPRDTADFARCRKLLEQVPGLAQRLGDMAEVGLGWKALIEAWDCLCATMDAEAPQWRDGAGKAPNTCSALKAAIGAHQR